MESHLKLIDLGTPIVKGDADNFCYISSSVALAVPGTSPIRDHESSPDLTNPACLTGDPHAHTYRRAKRNETCRRLKCTATPAIPAFPDPGATTTALVHLESNTEAPRTECQV